MIYWTLFIEFAKIGLFAIGGGMATLPFLQRLVGEYGWITQNELLDMIAVSEVTPGPIGVNAATYVGYEVGGVLGGVIATLGVTTPAVLLVVLLTRVIHRFAKHPLVFGAFSTLRPVVVGIIAAAALELGRSEFFAADGVEGGLLSRIDLLAVLLFGVTLALMQRLRWHPITFLAGAAVVGMLLKM